MRFFVNALNDDMKPQKLKRGANVIAGDVSATAL